MVERADTSAQELEGTVSPEALYGGLRDGGLQCHEHSIFREQLDGVAWCGVQWFNSLAEDNCRPGFTVEDERHPELLSVRD